MTDKKQNEVSESKEIPHEINSVSDLSQILQTLGEPEKGHTRFFRGHGDEGWQMLPSIYRETSLIENEDKIIKDALTYCPDDFSPSDTLFEKLVKLQHYGYSTRLLDLTANALVALYFAAWNEQHQDKDGELIILDIPNEEIKYGDSDTVAILSAISLQDKITSIQKCITVANQARNVKEKVYERRYIYFMETANNEEMEDIERFREELDFKNLEEYKDCLKKQEGKEAFLEFFNKQPEIISLLHDIQTDKPSFRPVIETSDLQRVICVRAKLNNQRISRQQGCFLLFGIKGCKTEAATIPDEWQRLASNSQKILVKAESKDAIMEELKSFGISKRTLFPELEAQATEIMNHYKGHK
ncbi:FRG domain-containing protein [Cardiobacterium hominis]